MSKELWIEAHEELITEYLEAHPEATDKEAEEATAAAADQRMADKYADMIDRVRDLRKEGRILPKAQNDGSKPW